MMFGDRRVFQAIVVNVVIPKESLTLVLPQVEIRISKHMLFSKAGISTFST